MTVKPDCHIKRFCDLGILFLLGDGSFAREGGGCPPGVWNSTCPPHPGVFQLSTKPRIMSHDFREFDEINFNQIGDFP